METGPVWTKTRKAKKPRRTHNEYFRPIAGRYCPECGNKLPETESVWSWGQYVNGKWRTVAHFCRQDFPKLREQLKQHTTSCGCDVILIGYRGTTLPNWLSI